MGFTPRRNPDIIVCVLFEGGEHGKLAARLATQVIKAYVDKQRRQPTKMAAGSGKVEVGSLWTDPSGTNEDGKNTKVETVCRAAASWSMSRARGLRWRWPRRVCTEETLIKSSLARRDGLKMRISAAKQAAEEFVERARSSPQALKRGHIFNDLRHE